MSLRLRNSWHYVGNDWWEWAAFLDDEGSGELSQVDYVEYVLHPTFPNPVRKVTDPQDGFKMKTAGWGVFMLKAFVNKKQGDKVKLTHMLEFKDSPIDGVSA